MINYKVLTLNEQFALRKDLVNAKDNGRSIIMFYAKILLEPTANIDSYRSVHALDCLKYIKDTVGSEIDWPDTGLDLDNFILPKLDIKTINARKKEKVKRIIETRKPITTKDSDIIGVPLIINGSRPGSILGIDTFDYEKYMLSIDKLEKVEEDADNIAV